MNGPGRMLRRIALTVIGTVIIAVGLVLLVAPGPGMLVIALGLAVFVVEYEWARRRLTAVRAAALSAAERTAASRVGRASAVLFGLGAIALGGVLIFSDVLPLSGAGTGISIALSGVIILLTTAYSIRELRRTERAQRGGHGPAKRG